MFRKLVFAAMAFMFSTSAYATNYIVWGAKLGIYAQSQKHSTANLIRSSKGIYNNVKHPWCGNRAYIAFEDKELWSLALAAASQGRSVNFAYSDADDNKHVAIHTWSRCRVLSMWW